ncbi:MAG: hypothetical protein HN337_05030 [Deltaproteobacteria bacterium]|jgi:hypothetical protein|nr:hypothetical protein [Deltaproteobacteria bacterium]
MKIPFYPNTGDGTHCFQAALKMALGMLIPEKEFSYEYLDEISNKKPGKWTWPTSAMLWMMDQGLEIGLIEEFDYRAFVDRGGEYLLERYGEEVGRAQIENSDVEEERTIAKEFVDKAPIEYRIPQLDDIEALLKSQHIVIINLNSAALHGHEGYAGHFIVICDIVGDRIILHDPGMPPMPNFEVSQEIFERAWGYPTVNDRNLLSICKRKR